MFLGHIVARFFKKRGRAIMLKFMYNLEIKGIEFYSSGHIYPDSQTMERLNKDRELQIYFLSEQTF